MKKKVEMWEFTHIERHKLANSATLKVRGPEKGKPNGARQDYFDHLWYSGFQGSNRQEFIGNFVCKIICTSTVDYFGYSYLQSWEMRHKWVLDDIVLASFFGRGRPWYNCLGKGSWMAIVILKALSWLAHVCQLKRKIQDMVELWIVCSSLWYLASARIILEKATFLQYRQPQNYKNT